MTEFAFVFCESVYATSTSPWHIRRLGPKGLRLTGGIDTPSLCNRVQKGWDLMVKISTAHLTHVCAECADAYRNRA
jgi:hypothetical protein